MRSYKNILGPLNEEDGDAAAGESLPDLDKVGPSCFLVHGLSRNGRGPSIFCTVGVAGRVLIFTCTYEMPGTHISHLLKEMRASSILSCSIATIYRMATSLICMCNVSSVCPCLQRGQSDGVCNSRGRKHALEVGRTDGRSSLLAFC